MPTWRCPHCGTPQAEASRCWVCKRSSTSCGTCRHFRRAIAGPLGYCGLDRHRAPLRGDELRGCWTAAPDPVDSAPAARAPLLGYDDRPRLDFVPLDPPARRRRGGASVTPQPPGTRTPASASADPSSVVPAAAPDPVLGFWARDEG